MTAHRPTRPTPHPAETRRRGAFVVVAVLGITGLFGLVALGLDLAVVSKTQISMQNAVDAAALAGAQEIGIAIENAAFDFANGSGSTVSDSAIEALARGAAADVAAKNGVFVDPSVDVRFGRFSSTNGAASSDAIVWGASPYTVVGVTARKTNDDANAPDAKMNLFFAHAIGIHKQALTTEAIAYIQPRDIVAVLDYSTSMLSDSTVSAYEKPNLNRADVHANMADIMAAYGYDTGTLPIEGEWPEVTYDLTTNSGDPWTVTVEWRGSTVKVNSSEPLDSMRFRRDNSNGWKYYNLASHTSVTKKWGDHRVVGVRLKLYDGTDKKVWWNKSVFVDKYNPGAFGMPGHDWDDYMDFVWDSWRAENRFPDESRGKMGCDTLISYLLNEYNEYDTGNKDNWKTPHYPFHAMKGGFQLFCDMLDELQFGDHLGLVTYDTTARWETKMNRPADGVNVDVSADPIEQHYAELATIQHHHSAGYYKESTNIGDGILKARQMLQAHRRYAARPVIFLMTDGKSRKNPSNFSLPGDWNWDELFDYDDDGSADYSTSSKPNQYALVEAKAAVENGFQIHALSVGAGAERDFMEAVAHLGGGEYIDVPGGTSVAEMEAELKEAFVKIAGLMPPPRLLVEAD